MPSSDWDETVRLDAVVRPSTPHVETQWALRYRDGQTLRCADEDAATRAYNNQDGSDPCVIVRRTITVTTTGWSEQ